MFSPSSRISPSTRLWRTVSFMRFSVRRKVDLPQPEGPMNAVTRLAYTCIEIPCKRLESAVIKIQIGGAQLGRRFAGRAWLPPACCSTQIAEAC